MNNRIYFTLILLASLISPTLAWSNPCDPAVDPFAPITSNSGSCTSTPDTYTVYLYKTGLCNNIDPSSATLPDMNANCVTTFDSGSSPLAISVIKDVSQPITGGTITRPSNKVYTHGFVLIGKTIDIKTSKTFSNSKTGSYGGSGNVCWTMTGNAGYGPYTNCGGTINNDEYGFTSTIVDNLGGSNPDSLITCTGSGKFHCTYVEDPYDITYAYLLSGNTIAPDSASVTNLLGFAMFKNPVTVNDTSAAMDVKFRVTQGVTVKFDGNVVNLYTAVFKTQTAIH